MSPTPRTPIRSSKAASLPDSPMCLTPLNSQRLNCEDVLDSPISDSMSPYSSSIYSDSSDIFNRISDVTYNYEKRSDVRKKLSTKPTQTRRGLTELYKYPKQTKKEDTKKIQEWKKQIQIEEFCETVLKLCKESSDDEETEVKENMEPIESKISEENSSQESFSTAPNNDLFDDSANDHLILASQQVEKKLSPEQESRHVSIVESESTKEVKKTNSSLSAIFEDSFDLGDLADDIKKTEVDTHKRVISKGSPPELKTHKFKSQKTPFQRYNSMPSTSLKQASVIEHEPLKKHPSSSSVNSSSTTSISSLSSASSTGSLLNGRYLHF